MWNCLHSSSSLPTVARSVTTRRVSPVWRVHFNVGGKLFNNVSVNFFAREIVTSYHFQVLLHSSAFLVCCTLRGLFVENLEPLLRLDGVLVFVLVYKISSVNEQRRSVPIRHNNNRRKDETHGSYELFCNGAGARKIHILTKIIER